MARISWKLGLGLAAAVFILAGTQRASAQGIIVGSPSVPYYYPAPAVSYYSPPVVYTPIQRVSYYTAPAVTYTPSVSYYYAPPVSYVAPAVSYYGASVPVYTAPASAVTTTRYGLFGRPLATTTYYYPR
jgi:hypothetical protein